MKECFVIESRINIIDTATGETCFGGWRRWTKKYNTMSALWDAWKEYKNRNWVSRSGMQVDGVTVWTHRHQWEFRPVHYYVDK